ncbi:MAG TPA: tripartite tricarboxylate transporter substrate binding protein [Roseomonas sp.]|jgi:tripartite-type tricarboxylate transporter receptor subunit TctC
MTIARRTLLGALPLLAAPATLRAQPAWPNRAVRLVVPFTGGGATDVTARVIAERLQQALGQPVVIDNRPGAGGNIGAELVAKSDDGHTLLMTTIGTASINQFLYSRMPFRQTDLQAVALVNLVANGILVSSNVPANTLQELVALAKRDPGGLSYGTPGNGTSGHLCAELLKVRTGIDLLHVPFRGSAGVIPELMAGRLQVAIDNLPPYLPYVREGRMKLLAVTSRERWFAAPDAPTAMEAGVEGFEAVAWFGIQAPARMPRAQVERLASLTLAACAEPAVLTRLRDVGSEPHPLGPAEFQRFIEAENVKWQEVVRVSGAHLD